MTAIHEPGTGGEREAMPTLGGHGVEGGSRADPAQAGPCLESSAPGLARMQGAWAGYFRQPDVVPRPAGTEPRRIDVYVSLLRNNIGIFIHQCFPICRQSVSPQCWEGLIDRFFAQGRWHSSPFFHEIPKAFVDFLQEVEAGTPEGAVTPGEQVLPGMAQRGAGGRGATHVTTEGWGDDDSLPPWFAELAHYEWLELAVETAPDVPLRIGPQGLSLCAALQLAGYAYPVHTIQPGRDVVVPETTFLVVYRDRQHQVRFSALTPAAAQLLDALQDNGCDWQAACGQLASQWGLAANVLAEQVAPLQQQWLDEGVLQKDTFRSEAQS